MSFALMSLFGALVGVAVLAVGLWFAQRLRVQHREVEVISTLFWRAAVEETKTRVFVQRFRHWWAWLLLVAIASFLWMLMLQPRANPSDRTKHIVLLDWSVEDEETRTNDLQMAMDLAATFPISAREIVAVGNHLETLVACNEPIEFARIRSGLTRRPAPEGMHWALHALAACSSEQQPLALHLVGDVKIEKDYLDALPTTVSISRIQRKSPPSSIRLSTLGAADSSTGRWDAVDVSFAFQTEQEIQPSRIQITVDDQPINSPLNQIGKAEYALMDVPARGGQLRIDVDDNRLGYLTLPSRKPIRVQLDADVPETLVELIKLDTACQIVDTEPDIRIGSDPSAHLRLSEKDAPAFLVESDLGNPATTLDQLIDQLALTQIDAMMLADQTDSVIEVQVAESDQRRIAIWKLLFSPAYDFTESRACPILIARTIRWLANQPTMVPWAQEGDRLPSASTEFDRAMAASARTADGREVRTSRLFEPVLREAKIVESADIGIFSRFTLSGLFGSILSIFLVTEWILYQRGQMP